MSRCPRRGSKESHKLFKFKAKCAQVTHWLFYRLLTVLAPLLIVEVQGIKALLSPHINNLFNTNKSHASLPPNTHNRTSQTWLVVMGKPAGSSIDLLVLLISNFP